MTKTTRKERKKRKQTKKAMRQEADQKKRSSPSSTSKEAQNRQNRVAARATARKAARSGKTATTKTTTTTTQYTRASYTAQPQSWTTVPQISKPQSVNPRDVYNLTPEERARAEHSKLSTNMTGYVSLESLVNAGVTQQDIQAVLNAQGTDDKKAKMINQLSSGSVNNKMASWADGVNGECHGDCLSGVQGCFFRLYGSDENSPLNKNNPVWNDYRRVEDKNSACSAPMVLKRSGDFLTVSVPNYASADYRGHPVAEANKKMNDFNKQLKPGTLVVASGRVLPPGSKGAEGTGYSRSEIHGHIWVKDNKGRSCSDGAQLNIKFYNYGPTVDISISMQASIDPALAKALLEQKEKRIQQTMQKHKTKTH